MDNLKSNNILLELSDDTLILTSKEQLEEDIKIDEEFDGFHAFRVIGRVISYADYDRWMKLREEINNV